MKKNPSKSALARIKLLLLDVDGVLTDGGIYYTDDGGEGKKFNTHDGYGIVAIQKMGVAVGIITGKSSPVVKRRSDELGVQYLYQDVEDKLVAYYDVKSRLDLTDREIAYIGDDEPDLEVLRVVGFSAAPANATEPVRKAVQYVCRRRGGEGAVREVIDLLCKARNGKQ